MPQSENPAPSIPAGQVPPLVLTPDEDPPAAVDGEPSRQKIQAARALEFWTGHVAALVAARKDAVSGREVRDGIDPMRPIEWCAEAAAFLAASLPSLHRRSPRVWRATLRFLGFLAAAYRREGKAFAATRETISDLSWWTLRTGDDVIAELWRLGMIDRAPNYRDNATGPHRTQLGNLYTLRPGLWLLGALRLQQQHAGLDDGPPAPSAADVDEWEARALADTAHTTEEEIASHSDPLSVVNLSRVHKPGTSRRKTRWLAVSSPVVCAVSASADSSRAVTIAAKSSDRAIAPHAAAPSPLATARTDEEKAACEGGSANRWQLPAELRAFAASTRADLATDARDRARRSVVDEQGANIRAAFALLTGYKPPKGSVPAQLVGVYLPDDAAARWLASDDGLRSVVAVLDFLVAAIAWQGPEKSRAEKFAEACQR